MNEQTKEAELQEVYMEFQVVTKQLKQMQEQLQTFEEQTQELSTVRQTLGDLEKVPEGTEMLVPLSSGVYMTAQIKKMEHVTVNVGANVAVTKSIPDTQALITTQIDEISKYKDQLLRNIQLLVARGKELEHHLELLSSGTEQESA